ncbi:TetR/AcrR family transcriptional regulator [Nocardia sp. NPDC051832]|uniref:TetR/AcrR family transcriptional regulator n=1 Tax=Nocardia sp. NPDC051832 TaxID=3155673 RepID=UPI0034263F65
MTQSVRDERAEMLRVRGLSDRGMHARTARAAQRQQVLSAAADVFGHQGYYAAQMREIADLAGMSKPTMYKHFSSKLDLYLTVLQSRLDRLVAGIREALNAAGGGPSRARAAVEVCFDFIDNDPEGFRLVFETEVPTEPAVRLRVDRAIDDCVLAVAGLLAREPSTDPFRARMLAAGLVGICRFTARQWLDSRRTIPKDQAITATVLLCERGLSGVPLVRLPGS